MKVFEADQNIELAFAVQAMADGVRQFADFWRAARGGQQINQNFEADTGDAVSHFHEELTAEEEEAAHGVGDLAVADGGAQATAEHAEGYAPRSESAHAPPGYVAATHDYVKMQRFDGVQHVGEELFIMLEICVKDCEKRRGRAEHSFQAGGG